MQDVPRGRTQAEEVFREERPRVFASLVKLLGDFEEAEDALQDAFVAALAAWQRDGIPDRPGAWIHTAARNAALSARRRRAVAIRKHREIEEELAQPSAPSIEDADIPDERLRLIFTCCHPALGEQARVALTLQTMCGLSTSAIARLFLVPEPTVAQRLVRAKRKIRDSGIPYEVPAAEQLDERLEPVLAVVYLYFTEGYASSDGEVVVRAELCEEAIRLGRVLCHLLPRHPEVRGLLALMLLHHARRATRTDAAGDIVALEDQDRDRWDRAMIAAGTRFLDEALAHGRPGPYQIQAAIAALHAGARRAEETDWPQIAGLYRELFLGLPSPAVAVGLSIAEGMASGAEAGLAQLAAFVEDGTLAGSDRVMAARADLLRRAGRHAEAREAYRAAIACARNAREARFLERRALRCL